MRVEAPAPAVGQEQMLGGWLLAEAENSQTLIIALNCFLNMCIHVKLSFQEVDLWSDEALPS